MSATLSASCNVVRFRRPARKTARVAEPSTIDLRFEGSLASVVTLAPVIPIFPALALAAEHNATSDYWDFHPVPA